MTNYDGRPPNLRPRTAWGAGWGAGWIVVIIVVLIIIGVGWDWGGWHGHTVANAPATNASTATHNPAPGKTP
jgi:hypothetical protein